MRKLFSFLFASLDGYHETHEHDIGWHRVDDEFDEFDLAQLGEADTFLLGRATYQAFAEFWPTDKAREIEPVRAIVSTDVDAEIRTLKEQPGQAIEMIGTRPFGNGNILLTYRRAA